MGTYITKKRLAGRKKFSLVLMLEPLHTCNLACSGCGRIREYSETLRKQMTIDECVAAAEESGAPIISICGGEPLIYPGIGELVKRLNGMGLHIYLCTNGQRLKEMLDEFEPSSRLIFNIHLDGPEKTHDAIVCREGAFDIAMEAMIAAKARGFLVSTNTTVYQQTEMSEIERLLERLSKIGVDSHMVSPAFDYEAVRNGELFLDREGIIKKFRDIDRLARFPLATTPMYLEFLKGERQISCSAWANPTRNPVGWRSPCYMLADKHYDTYEELMEQTDWDSYGPGKDARCADCMVHYGFEPSAVLDPNKGIADVVRLAMWQMK